MRNVFFSSGEAGKVSGPLHSRSGLHSSCALLPFAWESCRRLDINSSPASPIECKRSCLAVLFFMLKHVMDEQFEVVPTCSNFLHVTAISIVSEVIATVSTHFKPKLKTLSKDTSIGPPLQEIVIILHPLSYPSAIPQLSPDLIFSFRAMDLACRSASA